MFVRNAKKQPAANSSRHRTDRDAALDVLYPAQKSSSPSAPGAGYTLAQTFISNLRKDTINHDVLDLISRDGDEFLQRYNQKKAAVKISEESSVQSSMQAIVDKSFEIIEPYIAELNNTLSRSELRVASTAPQWVTENLKAYTGCNRKSYYRARISTSRLSIVIRGSGGRVEFFVLPASIVMGLSASENRHSPLMSFQINTANTLFTEWEVESKPLTDDRMERYCLLLFYYLLEETKSELAMTLSE